MSIAEKATRRRPWRHPRNRKVVLPYRTAAAVALMEMGISDYGVIAEAVGLSTQEIKRIDKAEDEPVRLLSTLGIPSGEYFKLEKEVRCPKCHARVVLAPCVACHSMLYSTSG